jgi:transposase
MEKWVEIRRQVLTGELSKRQVCAKYRLPWRTLVRILKHEEPAKYQLKEPRRKQKLDKFLPIIHEILKQDRQAPKKQRHTAQRSFERLQEQQYEGGLTIVKDVVRAWKQASRPAESDQPIESVRERQNSNLCLLRPKRRTCDILGDLTRKTSPFGMICQLRHW